MKILAPLYEKDVLEELVSAGAREFYADVSDEELIDWDKIEDMACLAHKNGAPFYISLYVREYHEKNINFLERYLEFLHRSGVDGIAVNVPELVPIIRGFGMKAIASAECGIQTSGLAQWYKKIGVNRLVLSELLDYEDVSYMMDRVTGVEYEVLLMRESCCGTSGGGALPCCGQCALYQLLHMGVNAVKLTGYKKVRKDLVEDVKLTYRNLQIAHQCGSEAEYLKTMILPDNGRLYCGDRFSCYYPAVC